MPDRRSTSRTAIGSMHIEQDVSIDAPPWRVYDALTKDVAAWWGAPAAAAGEPPRRLVLEAELGGRFYEEWPGGGCLLARVTSLQRADHLELTGPIGRAGTVHGRTRFELKPGENGSGTVLSLSARVIGEKVEEASYADGWNELLSVRLKGFVEAGRRASASDPPAFRPAPPPARKPPARPRQRKAVAPRSAPRSRRKKGDAVLEMAAASEALSPSATEPALATEPASSDDSASSAAQSPPSQPDDAVREPAAVGRLGGEKGEE